MIVSTTETIPGYKIVKVLGEVEARNNPFALALDMSKNAKEYLIKEAEKLGANAIVGFHTQREQYRSGRMGRKPRAGKIRVVYYSQGTAVIVKKDEDSSNAETTQDDEPLKALKLRYAKGEITKEEFEQMKKDIED